MSANGKQDTTNAARQAAYKARRRAEGLTELRGIWAHPDDVPAIRKHAAELAAQRAKASPQCQRGR